jgi:hypothetical protein
MLSNQAKPSTTTITTTEIEQASENVIKEKKEKLYLVLKKKNFGEEIVEEIFEEANKRFKEYIKSKIGKLLKINPNDKEKFIRYFLVSAYIKVLTILSKEYNFNLSKKDNSIINDIYNSENEKKKDNNLYEDEFVKDKKDGNGENIYKNDEL